MKVTLNRLTLTNFKGIGHLELEPKGKDLNIYGDNAVGKTTVFDAFHWVLFDKDSAGRKDFEILPLNAAGEVADHEAVATVTAELTIGSEVVELRKDYSEKWTRKRGQLEAEFAGHTTVYTVNGTEVPKNKYTAFVGEVVDEELFRLLANPFYFNTTLSWQKRRQMLMQIAAYEAVEAPEDIAEDLKRMGAEALKDKLVKECHQLEAEAVKKKAIMLDLQKDLPKDDPDVKQMEARMKEIEAEHKAETEAMYAGIKDLQEKIRIYDITIEQTLKDHRELDECELQAERDQVNRQRKEYKKWERAVAGCKEDVSNTKGAIDFVQSLADADRKGLEETRQEWRDVFNSEYTKDCVCGNCGLTITEDNFEKAKVGRLNKIKELGEGYVIAIEMHEKKLAQLAEKLAQEEEELAQELAREPKEPEAYGLPDYDEKAAYLDGVIEKARKAKAEASAELEAMERPYKELPQEWYDLQKKIAEALAAGQSRAKLEGLKDGLMFLREHHDKVCYKLDLLEDYTRSTIRAAEEAINSRFKTVRFKLFDELVNGDIKETCVASVNGVPYSDLNSAMKINAGLDIINAFSAVNDTTVPIFVDNAESVTHLAKTEAQVIRLVVSEQDKELRIEQD